MKFFGRAQSLLEFGISVCRPGRLVFFRPLAPSLILTLVSFSTGVFAQPIKFGYAALNAGQVAPWIAKEAGYLSKYGIEADLIYIPAVAATQALIAGEIQLAQVTKNLGISRFGALSDTAVSIFLQRFGLKRNTDVAVVQMGGLPEIITALERGAIQAGFANPPQTSRAKKLGMRELFDLNTLGVELQQTCVTVTTKYLRERRPVVQSFIQAYAEGLHRFITDRDFSVRVMKKYLRIDDKDILDDAYKFYSEKLEKIPYPTLKGIKFIIDEMAERNPQAKKATPESFVDLSVLQEIEQSGFFSQLWKN